MQRPVNRIEPALPAPAYKTYAIAAPPATHFRPASCAEVECLAWERGWTTTVDVSTELGARQANYIRTHSGRSYEIEDNGDLVAFRFPAGQECFVQHKVPLERPALFLVGQGDHRLFRPRAAQQLTPQQWQDSFGEHQDRLADRLNQG